MTIDTVIDKLNRYVEDDEIIVKKLLTKKFLHQVISRVKEDLDTADEILIKTYAYYLQKLWETDTEKFIQESLFIYDDIIYQDGKMYVILDKISDMSVLFHKDNQDTVEQILEGNAYELFMHYDWRPDDYTIKYELTSLSEKHQEELKLLIAKDMESSIGETFSLGDYSDNDEIEFTGEDIKKIMSGSLDDILDLVLDVDYFYEIKDKINILFLRTYECAQAENIYEQVIDKLKTFLPGDTEYISINKKEHYKTGVNIDYYVDAVHNRVEQVIDGWDQFLSQYNGFYQELEEYIHEVGDELSLRDHDFHSDTKHFVQCIEYSGVEEYYNF